MGYDYAPPKYAQVVTEIKRRIERGDYPPGSLLPSELRLVTGFAVSRPTIVKALSALRQEGWIDTQQGKGSFVRGRPALADAERTRPAHDVLELPEAQLSGELVQAGVKLAPPHVTALLGLKTGARAFVRQRLLSEDSEPVELASAWLTLEPISRSRSTCSTAAGLAAGGCLCVFKNSSGSARMRSRTTRVPLRPAVYSCPACRVSQRCATKAAAMRVQSPALT